jgi:Flp pilus assembly pilin Flp
MASTFGAAMRITRQGEGRESNVPMVLLYSVFQEVGMLGVFLRLPHGDAGQTMAEYAVVLGVITLAVVATLGLLNAAILNLLNSVIALI